MCGSGDCGSQTKTISRSITHTQTMHEENDAIDYRCLLEEMKTHTTYLIHLSEEREYEYRKQHQYAQVNVEVLHYLQRFSILIIYLIKITAKNYFAKTSNY